MSRHRNVRTMNYDEDYEGYDDVYGHSVEDDYPSSPSVSHFIFDRSGSRAPQMSQFFAPENDIAEEPEEDGEMPRNRDVEKARQRLDSLTIDSAVDEAVAELVPEEEILLKSCLDEIRDVVGDSFPDKVVISHILHAKFNREKALDNLLSGVTVDPTNLSHIPKKMKTQREPPIVRPQPLKPKDPVVKDDKISFPIMNGLSKNRLVDQTITGSVTLVKSQPNGITPVSLLEAIAFDHYKKCTTLPNETVEEPSVNGRNCLNPLMSQLANKTAKIDLKGKRMPTTESNMDTQEKSASTAIVNPLLATANPLLALKANIGQKPSLISNPLMASAGNMLNSSLKSDTNPLRAAIGGVSVGNLKSESTKDHSLTTLSRNPLFGGLKPTGFCTNPLIPTQNPINIPLLTPIGPLISPSNSLPSGTPDGGLTNSLLGFGKKPLIPRPVDISNEVKPVENTPFSNKIFPKPMDLKTMHISTPVAPFPPKAKILTRADRFNRKPKFNYEYAMATPRSKLAENITSYPVPIDNTPLEKGLIKEIPSSVGLRFTRRRTPMYFANPCDENVDTIQKVWMVLSEVLPEKIFQFDTPSPDALVGNASDFVATRAQDDSAVLTLAVNITTPADIETKVFPVLESHASTGKMKTKEKGKSKSLQTKKARSKSNGLRSKKK